MHTPHSMNKEKGNTPLIRLDAVNTTASKISHRDPPLKTSPLESQGWSAFARWGKIFVQCIRKHNLWVSISFFFFKKWLNFVDASDRAAKYRFSATNCSELLVGDHLKSTWHYLEAVGIWNIWGCVGCQIGWVLFQDSQAKYIVCWVSWWICTALAKAWGSRPLLCPDTWLPSAL